MPLFGCTCDYCSFVSWSKWLVTNVWEIFIALYLPRGSSNGSAFSLVVCGIWQALRWYQNFYSISFVSEVIQEIATTLSTRTYYGKVDTNWVMELNTSKRVVLTCSRLTSFSTFNYTIVNHCLQRVTQCPYLGILFKNFSHPQNNLVSSVGIREESVAIKQFCLKYCMPQFRHSLAFTWFKRWRYLDIIIILIISLIFHRLSAVLQWVSIIMQQESVCKITLTQCNITLSQWNITTKYSSCHSNNFVTDGVP